MKKEKLSSASRQKIPLKTEAEVLRKVTEWTKSELEELQKSSNLPICIEVSNTSFRVGTFVVEQETTTCWKVDAIQFTNKRSAIFFCVLLSIKRFADANELRDNDLRISKYDADKSIFRARLDAAHRNNDQFKIDLYSSRFDEAKQRLAYEKSTQTKIINKIKYMLHLNK